MKFNQVKSKKEKHGMIFHAVLLVRQKGFEPPTFWFVAKHSIQLSYWRTLYMVLFRTLFSIPPAKEFVNTFLRKDEFSCRILYSWGVILYNFPDRYIVITEG